MRIGLKLIAWFVLLALIGITIGSYVFFIQGSKAIEERTRAQLESVVVLKESHFNDYLEEEIEDLIGIREELPGLLVNQEMEEVIPRGDIRRLLKEHLGRESDFIEFFVLDLNGRVCVSTNEAQEGKIRSNELYFTEGREETFVQSFYYDLTVQQSAMTISTPIENNRGNVVGVLAGRINLEKIDGIMSGTSGLGETGETYLVNKFNFIVTESRFEGDLTLKKAVYTDGVRDCLKGNDGHGHYKDYRGIPVIGAYVWVPKVEACLLAEIDQGEAFNPINRLKNFILLVGIGIVIVVSLLSIFLSKRLTNPVNRLIGGVRDIGKGNLDMKIDVKSDDEIGQLASAFNRMTVDLKKSRDKLENYSMDLEKKVSERTEELNAKVDELERFNRLMVDRELRMKELKERVKELEGELKSK
jgi:methyl-accepting chemotaxis protein